VDGSNWQDKVHALIEHDQLPTVSGGGLDNTPKEWIDQIRQTPNGLPSGNGDRRRGSLSPHGTAPQEDRQDRVDGTSRRGSTASGGACYSPNRSQNAQRHTPVRAGASRRGSASSGASNRSQGGELLRARPGTLSGL